MFKLMGKEIIAILGAQGGKRDANRANVDRVISLLRAQSWYSFIKGVDWTVIRLHWTGLQGRKY